MLQKEAAKSIGINVIDKESLLAKEDRVDLIYETLSNKLQNTSISKNSDEISIRINSNNPDPIEISIQSIDNQCYKDLIIFLEKETPILYLGI